jgi:hypothetical protein
VGEEDMNKVTAEWVAISDDIAIVSRETGEFWLVNLNEHVSTMPFGRPMTGNGTRGSTAGLLNGAVAFGFANVSSETQDTRPVSSTDPLPRCRCTISLPKYVLDLIGSYHITHRTPGHFSRAAQQFRELNRNDVALYLETHGREETGHDRLVLKDLRALGLPGERIVANLIPDGVLALCELFDDLCSAPYPIGCIGYCYCFESTAAIKREPEVKVLEGLCPKGVYASRFLRTHSSLGSELAHVEEMIDFVAGLPASDRIEIVKAAYQTAMTMANGVRRDGALSDASILDKIHAAAGEKIQFGRVDGLGAA